MQPLQIALLDIELGEGELPLALIALYLLPEESLYIVDANGSRARRVWTDDGAFISGTSWSPDGRTIAYGVDYQAGDAWIEVLLDEGRNAADRPGSMADAQARIAETIAMIEAADVLRLSGLQPETAPASVQCLTLPTGATPVLIRLVIFWSRVLCGSRTCNDTVSVTFVRYKPCRHWTN